MTDDELKAAQRAAIAKLRAARKPRTAPEPVLRGPGVPGAFTESLRRHQSARDAGRTSERPPSSATDASRSEVPAADRSMTGKLDDGRFFMDAAADALAKQEGMDWIKRQGLMRQMAQCAALPYSHPHKLTARDACTGLPLLEGAGTGISATVLPRDVNAWLEALRMPYRWREGHATAQALQPAPGPNPVPGIAVHRLRRRQDDLLAPLIDRVRKEVADGTSTAQVMAELERLARLTDSERPAPLAGVNSGGIQWRSGGRTLTLTRRALGMRLNRSR